MSRYLRPTLWVESLPWAAASTFAAVVLGVLVAIQPKDGLVVLLAALALLAIARPTWAIVGVMVLAAVNNDVWLTYRLQVGSTPVSVLDLLPFVLLLSAALMRPPAPRPRNPLMLGVAIGLMAVGLIIGVVLGLSHHAGLYQLVQVARIELGLLITLLATALAGHVPAWRRAVLTGFIAAAWIVGIELILTYAFPVLIGKSFWGLLGISSTADVSQQVATGNVSVLRSVAINSFLVLPVIGLLAIDRKPRTYLLAAVGIVGLIVSLERSSWLALAVTIALVLAFMLLSGGHRSVQAVKLVVIAVAAFAVADIVAGGYVTSRLSNTNLSGQGTDISANYRTLETRVVWSTLRSSPGRLLEGTGTGVDVPAYQAVQATEDDYTGSTDLENSLFSRWVNFTILSVAGAALLLLVAFRGAWQLASAGGNSTIRKLGALGLCLPVILLASPISGALEGQGTLPYWLLAGTVLAAWPESMGLRRSLTQTT